MVLNSLVTEPSDEFALEISMIEKTVMDMEREKQVKFLLYCCIRNGFQSWGRYLEDGNTMQQRTFRSV